MGVVLSLPMVDSSRREALDSSDSSDEEVTHEVMTSLLSSRNGVTGARALEKKARSLTLRNERHFQGWEKKVVKHGQNIEEGNAMLTSARKSVKEKEKRLERLAARHDAVHQKATRNLLFASEADVEARHEALKESEKIRSEMVKVEADCRSIATDIEAAGVRFLKPSVEDHSKLETMLAVNKQLFGQRCQEAKKEATRILRGQMLDNRNRVTTAPNLAALRRLCQSGRAFVGLLATGEQTDAVIASTDAVVGKVEDICHEVSSGALSAAPAPCPSGRSRSAPAASSCTTVAARISFRDGLHTRSRASSRARGAPLACLSILSTPLSAAKLAHT